MTPRRALWTATLAAALCACGAMNPFRLEDQVAMYNDDLRWGRLPAAEQAVASTARAQFTARHARWGREIQIVDLELEHTRMMGLTALIRTRFVWTRPAETEIRESVVETRWRAGGNGSWSVDDEHVVAGDPTLLAAPPAPAAVRPPPRAGI